jgi:uncharacterized damage-inducible protein DinB
MTLPQFEPWLRGPLPGVQALLQPAAHALVAAREDIEEAVADLTAEELWATPGGAASIGYHLAHLAGSTDRLLTYARGMSLSADQYSTLKSEEQLDATRPSLESLVAEWQATVGRALEQIARTPEADLLQPRAVGRLELPTSVIGVVFHAAEHAQRHAGQVIATSKVVRADRHRV